MTDITFQWLDDWTIPSHVTEYDCYNQEPATCEGCIARWQDLEVSLWCIDDATDEYRREIEQELTDELEYEFLQLAIRTMVAS